MPSKAVSSAIPTRSRTRRIFAWVVLVGVVVLALAGRLLIDETGFYWPDGSDPSAQLLMNDRLQRAAVALIVGVALGVSGVALQALLRNPLAEPFILGLSTGAGLGIIAQGFLAAELGRSLAFPGFGAVLGTVLTLGIVFFASRRRGVIDRLGLLLVGVVLSTINGAAILLLSHLSGPGGIRDDLAQWMMGQLPVRPLDWPDAVAASVTAAGLAVLLWQGRSMDIATLDDDDAEALGVRTGALKTLLLVVASVLTATAVLIAGPIAFVGLIAPHLARVLLGPSHRPLLVGAALLGAALLVTADVASAWVASVHPPFGRIPVGIFTAMIGGPVFLWLLRPQLGRGLE